MCNSDCLKFGRKNLGLEDIQGKSVLEVGSYDINGSLRSVIEPMRPKEYIGVDIVKGFGVDVVCDAAEIRNRFGDNRFEVVVSTELIEHVLDWRKAVSNIKHLCRPRGVVLITTRSRGFEYHGWPYDFWRYELADMEEIFADFQIEKIEKDTLAPGVFLKARKPSAFCERDLRAHALFSIVENRKKLDLDRKILAEFLRIHKNEYRLLDRQSPGARIRKILRDARWNWGKWIRGKPSYEKP